MQLKNSRATYGWTAIALHWISAVGVVWLYFLGEGIEHGKEDGLSRPEIRDMVEFHVSIGMIFFGFLAARVIWHLSQKQPDKPDQNIWFNRLSNLVIWGFLFMISVQIITGPLIEWTAMRPVEIFGALSIPSPFPDRAEGLHDGLEFIHKTAPNLFWPLIALHIAGAVKHLVWDRDNTVQRMLGLTSHLKAESQNLVIR